MVVDLWTCFHFTESIITGFSPTAVVCVCCCVTGSSQRQLHRQLCGLVSVTPLGEILMSVQDDGQCEELYRRYIHDFVRSMHKCTHKTDETVQLEYQVTCKYPV